MLTFWNCQDIRKPFRGDSKLPDHHQEDKAAQGCPPIRIKDKWILYHTFLESFLLEEEKYIYLFLNPILSMFMNDNYPICGELANNSEDLFSLYGSPLMRGVI